MNVDGPARVPAGPDRLEAHLTVDRGRSDPRVEAGDLVAAQVVLAGGVGVRRAAAGLLARLVRVEPVGVCVPDIDVRTVDRAAVRRVENVDPEPQRHARLHGAGVTGGRGGVAANVGAAEHLVDPVRALGHARRHRDATGARRRLGGARGGELLERLQAEPAPEREEGGTGAAGDAECLAAGDLVAHRSHNPFVVNTAMIGPAAVNGL